MPKRNVDFELKDIEGFIEERPILPERFLAWRSGWQVNYQHPLGQVIAMAFPPLSRHSRESREKKSGADQWSPRTRPSSPSNRPPAWRQFVLTVDFSPSAPRSHRNLVKPKFTFIFSSKCLSAAKGHRLSAGNFANPAADPRFSARFPGKIAVIHSHLTDREKTDQWWEMIDGDKAILIGARSPCFVRLKI